MEHHPSQNPVQQQQQLPGGVHPQSYPQQQPLLPHQQYHINTLWNTLNQEAENEVVFRNHLLPVTRIRRIMKAQPGVKLVSSEAPTMIAKACEMFIRDLTLRAWLNAVENNTTILDVLNFYDAISHTEMYKFIVRIGSNSRFMSSSSEVGGNNPTVGGTSSQVAMAGAENALEFNPDIFLNEEELVDRWIQSPPPSTFGGDQQN